MNGYGTALPVTGGAGLAIGGVVIGQTWLLAIAAGLILAGIVSVRLSFRRGKKAMER